MYQTENDTKYVRQFYKINDLCDVILITGKITAVRV